MVSFLKQLIVVDSQFSLNALFNFFYVFWMFLIDTLILDDLASVWSELKAPSASPILATLPIMFDFPIELVLANLVILKETELHTAFSELTQVSSLPIENLFTSYHYSIPNVKLYYPEPFVASASLMHSDLWFTHILLYQYWLWFIFCTLITFFLMTFLYTIRWCSLRIRPCRETRGVSRSKCGDLITACVPVSWAASIIINESTDAIDYFDGFGTTEMVHSCPPSFIPAVRFHTHTPSRTLTMMVT
jgi:hypothetical protein